MPTVQAQVRLTPTSGVAEDVVTNTLYFGTETGSEAQLEAVGTALADFYVDLEQYFAGTVSRASLIHEIRLYDVFAAVPRTPLANYFFTIGSDATVQNFPQEVSLCLSYRASNFSGANMRRRRGRVYIGPLRVTAGANAGVGQPCRPTSDFQQDILDAYETMVSALNGEGIQHIIWSPTTGLGAPSVMGWVDNEFDTQRRRGQDPTSRISVNVQS